MRRLLLFTFTVNLILLASIGFENYVYKNYLIPKLSWTIDTLHLDWRAERNLYLECEEYKQVPM